MLLPIPSVLNAEELARVTALLARASFVAGRLSAGDVAQRVKHNEEAALAAAELEALNRIVMGNLVRHPLYRSGALPQRVAVPFYARYQAGMHYGDHVDDPIMGPPGGRYRSDVSITVFLSPPEAYDGGELVVETPFGPQAVKLAAGDAVLYPSASLHRVAPLTRGERMVAVTWVQSLVRDPSRRELLHTLNQARESLLAERPGAPESTGVDRVYVNLLRMWAEL